MQDAAFDNQKTKVITRGMQSGVNADAASQQPNVLNRLKRTVHESVCGESGMQVCICMAMLEIKLTSSGLPQIGCQKACCSLPPRLFLFLGYVVKHGLGENMAIRMI